MAMLSQVKMLSASSLSLFPPASFRFTLSTASLCMVCKLRVHLYSDLYFIYMYTYDWNVYNYKIWYYLILSSTEQATQGQTTLLVVTAGSVKFEGNKQRYFNQNFLLTAQASPNSDQPVWKIASDCFRFQDWANWIVASTFCIAFVLCSFFFCTLTAIDVL